MFPTHGNLRCKSMYVTGEAEYDNQSSLMPKRWVVMLLPYVTRVAEEFHRCAQARILSQAGSLPFGDFRRS